MKFNYQFNDRPNNFLILTETPVEGVVVGDEMIGFSHWDQELNKSILCNKSECCQRYRQRSFKFRVNFIVKENGQFTAKILERGKALYRALGNLSKVYPLDKIKIMIVKSGKELNTTYNAYPAYPNCNLSPEDLIAISKVPLNDLSFIKEKNQIDKEQTKISPELFGENYTKVLIKQAEREDIPMFDDANEELKSSILDKF